MTDAVALDVRAKLPVDEPVFLALYARTANVLIRYLRRLTGNDATAEDLVQETYLRFLGQASVPADEEHQKNYLFRIATNLARDHYRRSRKEEARHAPGTLGLLAPAPPPADGDVWAVIANLPTRDRELLLLAYVEGLTHREIAGVTGLMRASIAPLLFRARRRFIAAVHTAGLERWEEGVR
jgi:RNA polymerase sigma-70 factor (ECF subfamily)